MFFECRRSSVLVLQNFSLRTAELGAEFQPYDGWEFSLIELIQVLLSESNLTFQTVSSHLF